jgi:enoyl-CoA hydratase/carnithine racemase
VLPNSAKRDSGAAEALRWGLVNRVVLADELFGAATELARRICAAAPLAIAAVKEITRRTAALDVESGYRLLRTGDLPKCQAMLVSDDALEGPRAFAERRAPRWTGT